MNTYRYWKDEEGNWHNEYVPYWKVKQDEFDNKVRDSLRRIKEADETKEQSIQKRV